MKNISGNQTFEVGAKVIVDWRGCLYEAKIVKVNKARQDNRHYFVHFNGWSSNHDEWKALEAIYPMNSENLKTLREHNEFIKNQSKNKNKRKADDAEESRKGSKKEKREYKSSDKSKIEKSSKGSSDKPSKTTKDKSSVYYFKSDKSDKSSKSSKSADAEKVMSKADKMKLEKAKYDKARYEKAKNEKLLQEN